VRRYDQGLTELKQRAFAAERYEDRPVKTVVR
jgi:hypothetical protein